MTKIESHESEIKGSHIFALGNVVADETSRRIHDLVNGYLIKLGHDDSGWATLFKDPGDGRLWELIYAQSELHGGGPPSLFNITRQAAELKYQGIL